MKITPYNYQYLWDTLEEKYNALELESKFATSEAKRFIKISDEKISEMKKIHQEREEIVLFMQSLRNK